MSIRAGLLVWFLVFAFAFAGGLVGASLAFSLGVDIGKILVWTWIGSGVGQAVLLVLGYFFWYRKQ